MTADASEPTWFDRRPPRRRRNWSSPRHDRVHLGAAIVAVTAVFALVLTLLVLYPSSGPSPPTIVSVRAVVNTTAGPRNLGSEFWGVNVGPNVEPSTALADALARSPARVVRFPGGASGDEFNFTAGTLTNDSGVAKPAVENLSEFSAWCRSVACEPILELPGEIDSPSTGAFYVAYAEQTLGVHPIAWEIGNEPALWSHFGVPWSGWTLAQRVTPTPSQYAQVVRAYVAAIRAVDATAPILGLPGVGTGEYQETAWINATVALNGPNLSGVAIHAYPAGAGPGTTPTLQEFLANTSGPRSLSARVVADEEAMTKLPGHPALPIFVTELGTGLASGSFSTFLYSFPSVPFVASELISAALAGVASVELTQIQTPHGGSWMDGNDTTHPLLPLYTQLLPELGASVWPVAIEPAVPGVYAMATSSGGPGPAELFVANANASIDVHLDVAGSGLDLVGAGTRWSWNSSTAAPLELNLTSVPSLWDVAPDSVLLIKLVGGLGPAAIASVPSHGAPAVQHAPGIKAVARRVI